MNRATLKFMKEYNVQIQPKKMFVQHESNCVLKYKDTVTVLKKEKFFG